VAGSWRCHTAHRLGAAESRERGLVPMVAYLCAKRLVRAKSASQPVTKYNTTEARAVLAITARTRSHQSIWPISSHFYFARSGSLRT
jgi:hypothetical protein